MSHPPIGKRALVASLVAAASGAVLMMPGLADASSHQRPHDATPSASSLVSRMKAATKSVRGVRLTIHATQRSPKLDETITVDSDGDSGSQTAVSGKEHASVLLNSKGAYLSGNASGLTTFFALPKDDLALVGSKWISIKPSSSQYKSFVSAITVHHLLANLVPTSSSLTVHKVNFRSIPAYEVDWSVSSSGSKVKVALMLPRSGRILPLGESETSGTTVEHLVLSRWDEQLHIHTPKNTIAITKLHQT